MGSRFAWLRTCILRPSTAWLSYWGSTPRLLLCVVKLFAFFRTDAEKMWPVGQNLVTRRLLTNKHIRSNIPWACWHCGDEKQKRKKRKTPPTNSLQHHRQLEAATCYTSATMTPSKNKRPLPSSTSTIFPEPPETFQQWRTALKKVNILYLRGQWKECFAKCNRLLLEAKTQVWSIGVSSPRYD